MRARMETKKEMRDERERGEREMRKERERNEREGGESKEEEDESENAGRVSGEERVDEGERVRSGERDRMRDDGDEERWREGLSGESIADEMIGIENDERVEGDERLRRGGMRERDGGERERGDDEYDGMRSEVTMGAKGDMEKFDSEMNCVERR
ncbi:hypothetical protein Tco_0489760 [Tanacetum coccineum]